MLLHVAMYGRYYRGQIGILQKKQVAPPPDSMTDFLARGGVPEPAARFSLVGAP